MLENWLLFPNAKNAGANKGTSVAEATEMCVDYDNYYTICKYKDYSSLRLNLGCEIQRNT